MLEMPVHVGKTSTAKDDSYIPRPAFVSARKYLVRERAALDKHEYVNGEVREMSGASRFHNLLVGNIVTVLNLALAGREDCEVYPSDIRVQTPLTNPYTYPDVVAVCGDPVFTDSEVDTLLNPTVIVEVLSRSTSDYDWSDKFASYRTIPSLYEYVLVSQDTARIEVYSRPAGSGDATRWIYEVAEGAAEIAFLRSVSVTLPLLDIYRKVVLPASRVPADGDTEEVAPVA